MNSFFKKHQDITIISVLLIVTLLLLLSNLNKKESLSAVERVVMTAFSPFQDSVAWVTKKISFGWDDYIYLVGVKKENKRLKEAADKLMFENTILVEQLKHYGRLGKLLTFPKLDEVFFEAASVIGRDTTGRVKQLTINKGSDHGIKKNMPVVTHRGLVGRVVLSGSNFSKVLLITDVRSAIDALVQETRAGLVVVGANSRLLDTRYLAVNSNVKDGDQVVSSGFGGVFPKGLLIGVLKNVSVMKDSLFLSAQLQPLADLDRIEEALVLKGPRYKPADTGEEG
ncbi:Rod shape-determining protein MreC [hydrothermal vent metagenome]|uniref:Cell shape-determining protein MreC n=1 Tax=hydrothermal vent metagenome TaxID=652676 RepID=A0A3B1BZB6_9ZZZZ